MARHTVHVAMLSSDPLGLTAFDAFDPESFLVISAITDALVWLDGDGVVRPGLATGWTRRSPVELDLELRRGVSFHDGEPFDADSVIATFHAHKHPEPSATERGLLARIASVQKLAEHHVRVRTAVPDALLLRRLAIAAMYPRRALERGGRAGLARAPIGTGRYRFVSYQRGDAIVLERNPHHWSGAPAVDCLRLPIVRRSEWVDRLASGELDLALGLDAHDRVRAAATPGLYAASCPGSATQSFLLAARGPLADARVRRALNHAIHRRLLVDITEHGFAVPQRSPAGAGDHGGAECAPYRYSPELARALLAEAGLDAGLVLRGIVSETSAALYLATKEMLARVGVRLDAEILPRGEWFCRLAGARGAVQRGEPTPEFAIGAVDNPLRHALYVHEVWLHSAGVFSLLSDPDYDARYTEAARAHDDAEAARAQAALERYARDEALAVFTVHSDGHAAWREGYAYALPASGLLGSEALLGVRVDDRAAPARPIVEPPARDPDLARLLEATAHASALFLPSGAALADPAARRLWRNLRGAEQRWRLLFEAMIRELVATTEARTSLANILESTERVAIVGYSVEGRRLFVNVGYEVWFGDSERPVYEHFELAWSGMREQLDEVGSWLGPVALTSSHRPPGGPEQLYLSASRALDDDGSTLGYVFVLSDLSSEEERIRNQATRSILANVPYGLLLCDARGAALEGASDACARLLVGAEGGIAGRPLTELLGLDARAASQFQLAYEQIFEDVLPEQVSLANLPERLCVGSRTLALTGAVVRTAGGAIRAILFSLLDISPLIDAERDAAVLRGTLAVVRHRARFGEVVRELHARLRALASAEPTAEQQEAVRLELHTAKGVFGQFSLSSLAGAIHDLEALPVVTGAHLRELDTQVAAVLEANRPLWGIDLERAEPSYELAESDLAMLEARVAAADSLEEARRAVAETSAALRRRPARELMGPLEESCAIHAARAGKRVRLVIDGGGVRWPADLAGVFAVVPHLIRNAIDHGIEPPAERGSKAAEATVRVAIEQRAEGHRIEVSDDGRGIDAGRVAARAIALGAVSPVVAAGMTAAEQRHLIFVGGLSTADEATSTSGRGVGMAAVQRAVAALGGDIAIASEPGVGTTVTLRFPR